MKTITITLFLIGCSWIVFAQEAQWRGENRDGKFSDTDLLHSWPEEGPELLADAEGMGRGFSMPVVENGIIYVTGSKDSMDYLSAVDLKGSIHYSVPFAPAWSKSFPESRSAPTIIGNRAVVINGSGTVACLDKNSGRNLWSVDGFNQFEGRCGEWGIAESPLVVDGKVIYTPGGSLTTMVALDLNTGETVWTTRSLEDTTAYVSPILVEYAGKNMIVGMTASFVFGVDAADGSFLWTYKYYDLETPLWHPWAPVINCISPLYKDGMLYVTSGYDHVGVMLELNESGSEVSMVWKDTVLDCHHGGVILIDGHIYGSNWIDNNKGDWCCIEWETGRTNYVQKWETKGSVITAENLLYCYEERRGNMALVKASPEDFEIISSFRIRKGTGAHWAHPAISEGKLIVRHGGALMIYNIAESFDESVLID